MKKNDLFVLLLIAITLILVWIVQLLIQQSQPTNRVAEITVDGQLMQTLKLNINQNYTISSQYGINVVQVKNNQIAVISSDCGNNDCIHIGAIQYNYQAIVCVPHHLEIKIKGDTHEANTLDAVSQ